MKHYENLIDRLRNATKLPMLQALCNEAADEIEELSAADVVEVVRCKDCKYNNACLTQAFVEEESRAPFDRSAFFCADGERTSE